MAIYIKLKICLGIIAVFTNCLVSIPTKYTESNCTNFWLNLQLGNKCADAAVVNANSLPQAASTKLNSISDLISSTPKRSLVNPSNNKPNSRPPNPQPGPNPATAKFNYSYLESLLKNRKFKEADEVTVILMQRAAKLEGTPILDVSLLPRQELGKLDRLWLKYSGGRFGFSVQRRIWNQVGGSWRKDLPTRYKAFYPVADRIGWRKGGKFIYYNQYIHNLSAPKGHLPALVVIVISPMGGAGVTDLWAKAEACKI